MQSKFEWTASGDVERYLTDQVSAAKQLDADEYTMLDWSTYQDVRRVRLLISVTAVFEEVSAAGAPVAAASASAPSDLYRRMLNGDGLRFYPDAEQSTSIEVVPDLTQQHTLLAVKRGMVVRGRRLALKSKTWLAPDAQVLDDFAHLFD